jgi:hypothetical protein
MAEIKRYVVLDQDGKFENIVVWDGESEWSPPENHRLVLEDSDEGRASLQAHNDWLSASE